MWKNNKIKNSLPAISLMIMAPLIAEILPGSTRFSSIMVFPIEVFVWGGGALLIRYTVRKFQLDWISIIFLGLALSVAEEFLIQQTSIAPMVVQIKGLTYARGLGINYVYLLWALIYETVFVVILPIYLCEIIFHERRKELWIGKRGVITTILLFLSGSFLAWYSWTQIARPKVFHVASYSPTFVLIMIAIVMIGLLIFTATGPMRNKLPHDTTSIKIPSTWIIGVLGGIWAIVLYALVLLAFGILPSFPPLFAIAAGLILIIIPVYFLPRWANNSGWQSKQMFSLIFGVMLGSMISGSVGFIGAARADLYFKTIIDLVAVILLLVLGYQIYKNQKLLG